MDLKEIKEKAKKLGIEPKRGIEKETLIHSIQTAEGNCLRRAIIKWKNPSKII